MRHQIVEQNRDIKADNKSFKKCGKICILEADSNKSKLNREEIKFVECLPQSVYNYLHYHLLSKSVNFT